MEPIKILYVVTSMNRGGIETMIMNHYRLINRKNIQIDFLVHREERGAYDDEIEKMGGVIYRIPPISLIPFSRYKKQLNNFFENHSEYSIVHSHMNALSYFVLKAAQRHGVKIRIAHSHIASTDKGIKGMVKEFYKKRLNKYCNYMFACGEKAGRYLFGDHNYDTGKVKIFNNAIDSLKYEYDEKIRNSFREELGIDGKFVIGHIARLTHQKNQLFLIDIFKELVEREPNSVLLVIGTGEEEGSIKQKITDLKLEKNVKLLGVQSNTSPYYQAMDVFLLPSLYEGLPVTLIEAQAAGVMAIAADTIDKDVKITELLKFIPLNISPEDWAREILQYKGIERKRTSNLIKQNRYDVVENTIMLEKFYNGCVNGGHN